MTKEEFKTLKIGDKVVFHKHLCNKSKYEDCKHFSKNLKDNEVYTINALYPHNVMFKIETVYLKGMMYYHPIDVFTIYKEEFVLPEKWCIKHYKEVADYIIKLEGHNYGNYVEDLKLYSHFPPQPIGANRGYCYDYILKNYTEITFEQFKKYVLKEEYKYTPEYCKNPDNKVAIHVVTPEEVKECDELLNNNKAHVYLYNNLCYNDNTQCIDPYNNEHSNIDWFKSNNYDIIEAKDFINKNKKEMKKKKTFEVGDVVLINTVSKGSVNTVGKGVVQAIDDKGWAYVTSGFNHKVDKTPRWEEFDNLTLSSLEEGDWMVIDNLNNRFTGKIGHVGRVVDTEWGVDALYKLEPYCVGTAWHKSNLRFATIDEIPKEPIEYTFRFADTIITVTKGKIELSGVGKGIVTIEELEAVINYFKTPPSIAGYGVAIYDCEREGVISMYNDGYKVAFGCQDDELSILEEVKDAYYKLNK